MICMHRFTFVLVIVPASILFDTHAWTADCSCCLEKNPNSSANSLPTSQVTSATALDVFGSYKHAFFRRSVFSTSDEALCKEDPG